ncbi:MAG: hypothetical protein JKY52_09560 [Flavobacteriales bacterium]|nr:hypothetical protein [Flavobacteriales bacterium]
MGKPVLETMTKSYYDSLLSGGMLYEYYPKATGVWANDCCEVPTAWIEARDEAVKRALSPKSDNNGGSTEYYKIDPTHKNLQDKIEKDDFNFSQGNILKSAWTLSKGRHEGTGYERELNKIIFFAQRELDRL